MIRGNIILVFWSRSEQPKPKIEILIQRMGGGGSFLLIASRSRDQEFDKYDRPWVTISVLDFQSLYTFDFVDYIIPNILKKG